MNAFETMYRLARSEADFSWPRLDGSGVSHGIGTPLLNRRGVGSAIRWQPRAERELAALFSAGYDEPLVDATGWHRSLAVVAKALNDGDVGLALTALVLCRIPPLPSEGHAHAMALAEALMKYNRLEPRIPSPDKGAGEWTAGSDTGIFDPTGFDSEMSRILWPILRDTIERSGPSLELAKNVLEEVAGNVSEGELASDIIAFMRPPKTLYELRPKGPFTGFPTWRQLKNYIGDPPPGYEWHHVVERSVADEHPEDPYISYRIENTRNIVLIPKLRHLMITADMNTEGVRGMVHLHDLDEQFRIGEDLLRKWGALE